MQALSHNDNPAKKDDLNQRRFIEEVANVIRTCTPPKGIAINGYWGTGKTTILHIIMQELSPESVEEVVPIWFEAWRYQHESQPIVALLSEIRTAFSRFEQLKKQSKKLGTVSFLGVLGAFDEAIKTASKGFFRPKLSEIPKIGEKYEQENYETPLLTADIKTVLQEAINTAVGNSSNPRSKKPHKKLVIFIDDLDRCNPEAALKLLEGIKVYLNLDNCVTVFAIDQRQIEQALAKALDIKGYDDKHQATEYLEKICQDIYHLPLPNQSEKAEFMKSLLFSLNLGGEDETKAETTNQHTQQIAEVLEKYDCLPANPRKIKVLANRLAVMLRTTSITETLQSNQETNYKLLVMIAVIYAFHRKLYEQLVKRPECVNDIKTFAETGEGITDLTEGIRASYNGSQELHTNPSDSNVFRLHSLLISMNENDGNEITPKEIKPFLAS